MIVSYKNRVYCISFLKKHRPVLLKGKIRLLIDTVCVIRAISGFACKGRVLGRGKAKQNINDKYSKVIGKKVALRRAIFQSASISGDKKERTAIWKKFHETFVRWV